MASASAIFTPPPRRYAPGWLYALFLALLFNIGFVYLFRPESSGKNEKKNRALSPGCILVQLEQPATTLEAEVAAYSELADPTVITLPHPEFGLMSFLENPQARVFHDLPEYTFTMKTTATRSPGGFFDDNPVAFQIFTVNTLKQWNDTLPPPKIVPQQRLPREIIWHFPDGTRLTPKPELTADESETFATPEIHEKLTAPTVLRIQKLMSGLTRTVVESGSGSPELDEIAARAAARWALRGNINLDENNVIEVEWRLVAPDSAQNSAESPNNRLKEGHDRDRTADVF
jgi:hypothetical protein